MPLCSFGEKYAMFDITPVENLYIEEYMLRAPGDYVKVYLYGLKLCYHGGSDTLATMARDLAMDEETVRNAFLYWERQGVLRRIADNPPAFAYYNLKEAMMQKGAPDQGTYAYRDFNNALQAQFGTRLLHPADFQKMFDWLETLHLPQEVVLLLVQHGIRQKGVKVTMNYLDKLALQWADAGLRTQSDVEDWVRRHSAQHDAATQILRQLGLRRAPTVDETTLVEKWMGTWELSLTAILFACGEMTGTRAPNMKYLDKVLEGHVTGGRQTKQAMADHRQSQQTAQAPVRALLYALGTRDMAPTPELIAAYQGFLAWGFEQDTILRAAAYAVKRGGNRFEDVERILAAWRKESLFTMAQVDEYLRLRRQRLESAQAVLVAAGDERAPTAAESAQVDAWLTQWQMPTDLILLAADRAKLATGNKIRYIHSILDRWRAQGIQTLEAARNDTLLPKPLPSPAKEAPTTSGKAVAEQRYGQREYSEEELSTLLDDLSNLS